MADRVGLVGYSCDTGLGITNATFYTHLSFDRWLVVEHPNHGVRRDRLDERCTIVPMGADGRTVRAWLNGLDCIFAIEVGYVRDLWRIASQMEIATVLMPNVEWFHPDDPEMQLVDRFIAPTRHAEAALARWGFGSRTTYVPHPVDVDRFAFRRRATADVFLHCAGWSNGWDRKGTGIVREVAWRCPDVRFIVRYQRRPPGRWPANVRLLGPVSEPEEQYLEGAVALQPSRWEGVGLQILESMSSGLPTIVTDGAPMNEYPADADLCIDATPRAVDLATRWTALDTGVDGLVDRVKSLHGRDVSHLSDRARSRIEERSWARLVGSHQRFLGSLASCPTHQKE